MIQRIAGASRDSLQPQFSIGSVQIPLHQPGEGCGAGVLQDQTASAQLARSFSPSHSRDSLSFGSGKATFAVSDDRFKDSTTAWSRRERHSLHRVPLPHESLAERCDEVLVRRSISRPPGGDGEPCRERPALPNLCVKHTRKPADPRPGDFRQLHGSVLVSARETNQELVASDSISLASVALLAPDQDGELSVAPIKRSSSSPRT